MIGRIQIRACGLAVVAGTAVGLGTAGAGATVLSWLAAVNGSAGDAARWNPSQAPAAADTLTFNVNGSYAVTFPASAATTAGHTYKRGTVTVNVNTPHTATGGVRVGDVSGDAAAVVHTSGTLHAGSSLVVGNAAGSSGTLTVEDEGTLLTTSAAGSDMVIAQAGVGVLHVLDGALVQPADDCIIGASAGSNGDANVTGTGGLPLPVPSSTLSLPNAGQDLIVGQSGTGRLDVSGGAMTACDELFVALNPGSTGIVTVGGSGGVLNQPARITVATQAHLGNNPSIGATAGSATLTVNAGGEVNVTGTTRVGDPQGVGSGTLTVNTGGLFRTGALVASDAGGFLNLLGGELHVVGGTLAVRNDVLVLGSSPAGSPVLTLDQGAACTLGATAAPFETLTIGDSHAATVRVIGGSSLSASAGEVVVGNTSGSQGTLAVIGADSRLAVATSGTVVIGDAGQGAARVQQGATATTGPVSLGRASGSGLMLVDGPGSRWSVTGPVAVGGTSGAASGVGVLTVSDGGTLSVTTPDLASTGLVAWGPGDTVTVGAGAALETNGVVLIADQASLTLAGGRISAHKLRLMGNSLVYAVAGIIEGEMILAAGSSTMQLTGDLTLRKNPAGRLVISNSGLIEIGSHTLAVAEDPSQTNNDLNRCHLGPAGRLESAFPLQVGFTATLSGSGTVNAPIVNLGSIEAEGGGLTFTKVLEGVGHSIDGTRIILGAGGGFTGSGGFSDSTQVLAQAGSVIRATGALHMGAAGSTAGFTSAGRIEIPVAAAVTLRDADGARVHDVAFMETNTFMPALVCASGLTVTGTVTGTGLLGGDANSPLEIGGTVSPSGAGGGAGEVRFSGDTTLQGTTTVVFDIFGAASRDTIVTIVNTVDSGGPIPTPHASDLHLGGTLVLRVAPGHTPSNGERHQLIRVQGQVFPAAIGQVLGDFDTVDLPPKWQYQVVSSSLPLGSNGVFVKFCAADFNNDRAVDPDDLSDYIACFFAVPPCPDADINGDGNADPDDLSDFIGLFFSPCG